MTENALDYIRELREIARQYHIGELSREQAQALAKCVTSVASKLEQFAESLFAEGQQALKVTKEG